MSQSPASIHKETDAIQDDRRETRDARRTQTHKLSQTRDKMHTDAHRRRRTHSDADEYADEYERRRRRTHTNHAYGPRIRTKTN